jgi:hypothetical protein
MANDRIQFEQQSTSTATALSFVISGANQIRILCVNIDALPTTSENLTITLNAAAGSDHVLYSVDPSVSSGTQWDLFWNPEPALGLAEGDIVTVAYTNTDTNTVSVVANCVPF